eukprot:604907-Pyramimonas_sp.AAC.1
MVRRCLTRLTVRCGASAPPVAAPYTYKCTTRADARTACNPTKPTHKSRPSLLRAANPPSRAANPPSRAMKSHPLRSARHESAAPACDATMDSHNMCCLKWTLGEVMRFLTSHSDKAVHGRRAKGLGHCEAEDPMLNWQAVSLSGAIFALSAESLLS